VQFSWLQALSVAYTFEAVSRMLVTEAMQNTRGFQRMSANTGAELLNDTSSCCYFHQHLLQTCSPVSQERPPAAQ
jgi:hypothetical protein